MSKRRGGRRDGPALQSSKERELTIYPWLLDVRNIVRGGFRGAPGYVGKKARQSGELVGVGRRSSNQSGSWL